MKETFFETCRLLMAKFHAYNYITDSFLKYKSGYKIKTRVILNKEYRVLLVKAFVNNRIKTGVFSSYQF